MSKSLRWVATLLILTGLGSPVCADVITDWNEKAVAFAAKHRMLPPQAERVIASVHVAMFDAVNSIERRYRPCEPRRARANRDEIGSHIPPLPRGLRFDFLDAESLQRTCASASGDYPEKASPADLRFVLFFAHARPQFQACR